MAANVITAIMPKIMAQALLGLRETAVMPQIINSDYSAEAKQKGNTIDVPIPVAMAATDVVPSNTPPVPGDLDPKVVQIPLDKWKKTNFFLTDKEMFEINARTGFIPMQVEEAYRALANKVNIDILGQYKGVYGYVGAAGTTPFASDASAIIQARKTLAKQLAPKTERRAVINPEAEANALGLAAFQDVDKAGSDVTKKEGEIGRKFGFDWYMEDALPAHDTLAAGTFLVDQADVTIGDETLHYDGGTTAPAVGDVFTVAGDTQTYVVTTTGALAGTDGDIGFAPAAKVAWANDTAITFKADHVVNLAFRRDAFAFANRGVDGSVFKGGSEILQVQDPKTGIVLCLEVAREYKQVVWEFSILYGVKLVRPEFAVRIAG